MFDQAARFTGDAIPTYYDSGLGPHLFADYAADLARRAAAAQPDRVLEIAGDRVRRTEAVRLQTWARTAEKAR
jgi:hypothetical protein